MKKLLFILLFLPFFTEAQTGVKWDRYFYTGSMKFGGGLHGYSNATNAAKDSASYSDRNAWLTVGNDSTDRGFMVARVVSTSDIDTPTYGLMCYQISDNTFRGFNGTTWVDLGTGGSGSTFDTTYIYHYIDSALASISAGIVDSSLYVTVSRLNDTAAAIRADFPTGSGFDSTYIYQALEDTAAAIRADFPSLAGAVLYTDTASMLNPYLRKADTANKWLPIGTVIPTPYDTTSLSDRIDARVKYSDTADMLQHYYRQAGFGLDYAGHMVYADSTVLSTLYALSDTADAIRNDFPTGGTLDTTEIYYQLGLRATQQALEDTAAAIRSDFPTGSGFDSTYIYAALADTAAAIRADFPVPSGYDTTYLYTVLDSMQRYTDTSTYDATKAWVLAQGYSTGTAAYDTTYLYTVLDSMLRTADTSDMLDPYLLAIDTTNKWLPIGTVIPEPYDTTYLYTVLDSFQHYLDTNTYDATKYWVGQQGYITGFTETDPLSPHLIDSNTITSTGYVTVPYFLDVLADSTAAVRADFPNLSGLVTQAALDDTAADIRADIPDVSGFVQYGDTADMLLPYVRHSELADTAAAIRNDIPVLTTPGIDAVLAEAEPLTADRTIDLDGSNLEISGGGSIMIGGGTAGAYGIEMGRQVYLDSVLTGSAGTDDVLMLSPNNVIRRVSVGDISGGGGVQYSDSLVTYVTPSQLSDSIAGLGGSQDLQSVTDIDYNTTNPLVSTNYIQGSQVRVYNGTAFGRFFATNVTTNKAYELPDASGDIPLLAQVITNGNTLTCPSEDAVFDALAAKADKLPTVNAQTGTTYTLLSSDNGGVVTISNGSAIAVTVPSGLPAGFNCIVIQKGAGKITFTGSGATVVNRQSFTTTAGTGAFATIVSDVSNNFYLGGDLE